MHVHLRQEHLFRDCTPNDKPSPRRLQQDVADVVDIVICTCHMQTQLFQKTRRHAIGDTTNMLVHFATCFEEILNMALPSQSEKCCIIGISVF
jgi:hypothetical protein